MSARPADPTAPRPPAWHRHRHGAWPAADGTTEFRVWAPAAQRVTLVLPDEQRELDCSPQPGGDGWFVATAPAGHGTRYAYRLDGGRPRPDPASRWQPDGVHAASAVVAFAALRPDGPPAAFAPVPLDAAVLYELHVGAFTAEGTFEAAAARLAHLSDLGVTHVEVLPVNAVNGTRNWGYDGVGWYAVHQPYGGPAGFARFVDACHDAGLGVILDVVYNHLGPSGNYLPEFGPYLSAAYGNTWGEGLNLDGPDSDPVRAFIVGNALQWLQAYRVDGLRLDAVHGLVDTSAVHVLAELADAVADAAQRLGTRLTLIAESDRNDPLTVTPRSANGLGMHAQWADDLHHAIHTAVTGERDGYYVDYAGLPDVADAYRRGFLYDGRWSPYRRRTVGAPLPETVSGRTLITCIQNHDQVGNRALGERLTTLVEPNLVRVAVLLLCASPTTPMLWMGEEYGETNPFLFFTSHPEAELGRAVSEGRREEFGDFASWAGAAVPDPQDPATFARSKLDWTRLHAPAGQARLALWRDLLRLRRDVAALGSGWRDRVHVLGADDTGLAVLRDDDAAAVLVVANLGDAPRRFTVPAGPWRPLLDTLDAAYSEPGSAVHERTTMEGSMLIVPSRSAAIWTA